MYGYTTIGNERSVAIEDCSETLQTDKLKVGERTFTSATLSKSELIGTGTTAEMREMKIDSSANRNAQSAGISSLNAENSVYCDFVKMADGSCDARSTDVSNSLTSVESKVTSNGDTESKSAAAYNNMVYRKRIPTAVETV